MNLKIWMELVTIENTAGVFSTSRGGANILVTGSRDGFKQLTLSSQSWFDGILSCSGPLLGFRRRVGGGSFDLIAKYLRGGRSSEAIIIGGWKAEPMLRLLRSLPNALYIKGGGYRNVLGGPKLSFFVESRARALPCR
jgi:hypothetical protein